FGAGQDADHIVADRAADAVVEADRGAGAERDGAKAALAGGAGERVEILAGGGEQAARGVLRQPADHLALVHVIARVVGIVLRAGPGRLDDVPAIGGRFGLGDDEHGRRALARSFLILIGPAAVIGHRAATERAGQRLRLPVGIVDEDDHRLAAD